MSEQTIVCPNCGKRIQVSEALSHQIEAELRKNFESEINEREKEARVDFEKRLSAETARAEKKAQKEAKSAASSELNKIQKELIEIQKREKKARADFEKKLSQEKQQIEKQAQKLAEQKTSAQLTVLQRQLREKEKESFDLKRQQAEVKKLENELTFRQKNIETELQKKLAEEKTRIEKQAQKIAEEKSFIELTALQKQLREKEKESLELKRQQTEVQKLQNQLIARQKALETEIEQKVEKASRKAENEVSKRIEAEYRNRELLLEKKLNDAKRQASELKQKLEQSSQQAQGEVVELELESVLKKAFPDDEIEPVAKGKTGADILQRVYTSSGQYCGTIIWEVKNTRSWSKAWLNKLRNDQRRAKAELAVLVSTVLPKEVLHFAQVEGIWVTELSLVIGVATALRTNLSQAALLKQSSQGKHEKMELLYEYLSSTEFRHRIEGIVEAFRSMQDDLDKERQTMEKQWAKRDMQIQLVVQNVAGMYGDMQGIAGQSLPKIRRLELPSANES